MRGAPRRFSLTSALLANLELNSSALQQPLFPAAGKNNFVPIHHRDLFTWLRGTGGRAFLRTLERGRRQTREVPSRQPSSSWWPRDPPVAGLAHCHSAWRVTGSRLCSDSLCVPASTVSAFSNVKGSPSCLPVFVAQERATMYTRALASP